MQSARAASPTLSSSRLARNFPGLRGADVAFASDLPPASGLSSSSALVVALFTALSELNALSERSEYRESITCPEDLGGYVGALENGRAFGGLAGEHRRDRTVEARAGDHRHIARALFHRRPYDRLMLGGRERVELAGAAGGDDRGGRVLEHRAQVPAQAVEVERQVGCERRHGKSDHALQLRPQLTW